MLMSPLAGGPWCESAAMRRLARYERDYLCRDGDNERLVGEQATTLPHRYMPESRRLVTLQSWWIDARHFAILRGNVPSDVQRFFFRRKSGRLQVRLLVHPVSGEHYREFIRSAATRGTRPTTVFGKPLSSARTMLILDRDRRAVGPFFAKISVAANIADCRRTLERLAVARSVGTTMLFDRARASLPWSFDYFPEPLGLLPNGMDRGGMLVRHLPHAISSNVHWIPLFALYAQPRRSGFALLPAMARAAGLGTVEFVLEALLRPFAEHWLTMAIDEGIVLEPHAQNLLLEIGSEGLPTGRFVHRDFEDVYVDYRHRALCGLPLPTRVPLARNFRVTYMQGTHEHRRELEDNLDYFLAGIIYNIDRRLRSWRAAGLIDGRLPRQTLEHIFLDLTETALRRRMGRRVQVRHDYRAFARTLYEARQKVRRFRSLYETEAWQSYAYLRRAFPRRGSSR